MSRRNTKQSDNRLFVDGERLFKKVMFLEDKGFKNILVTAPLESGKTSFVYDYLLGAGKKVAILSNRSLLKDQNKKYVKRTQAQKNKNESNITSTLNISQQTLKIQKFNIMYKLKLRRMSDIVTLGITSYF